MRGLFFWETTTDGQLFSRAGWPRDPRVTKRRIRALLTLRAQWNYRAKYLLTFNASALRQIYARARDTLGIKTGEQVFDQGGHRPALPIFTARVCTISPAHGLTLGNKRNRRGDSS